MDRPGLSQCCPRAEVTKRKAVSQKCPWFNVNESYIVIRLVAKRPCCVVGGVLTNMIQ